jgi:hypothetical protein
MQVLAPHFREVYQIVDLGPTWHAQNYQRRSRSAKFKRNVLHEHPHSISCDMDGRSVQQYVYAGQRMSPSVALFID